MTSRLPSPWSTTKPLERYETQFLYIGLSRYNTAKQTLSSLIRGADGVLRYVETPYTGSLARCYVSEFVTITVYSHSPRVWTEDTGPEGQTAFVQHQPTQAA
jgi:hypothetical protein